MLDTEVEVPVDELEMQTVTASGRPVSRRLTSAAAARSVYEQLRTGDDTDAYRRATIQGMIDGNQPYDPEMLKEQGLAHMTNVNFMSMRANLDARAAAAHEIFAEVPTLIELSPRNDDGQDLALHEDGDAIAEEFTTTVRDWKKFLPYMDLAFRESDAYGLGVALFPDEYDWRFKAVRRGSLLFSADARVGIDENELYMVRDSMSAADLLDYIENPLAAENGWHVEDCRELLVRTFILGEGEQEKYQVSMWESLQQMRRNNDPGFESKQFDRVHFIHILTRETSSGKVTHQLLPESDMVDCFLYEKPDRFESMSDAIWWLPFNYADGYARSIRGVASYMAMHDDLSNRFLCRVFDAGFMTSSLLLQPQTQTDLNRLQFVQHGPYTILPSEMKTLQSTFQPQISPLIQLRDVSESILKNNTGMYRQHPETFGQSSAPKTARQVMAETAHEARYEKAAIAHRYDHLDVLYRVMLERMVALAKLEGDAYPGQAEAKEFVKRLTDRGIKKSRVLNWSKEYHMQATRALGLGSPAVRYDITDQLLNYRMLMDERGQLNAFRDWLAARVGYANVNRYRMRVNRNDVPSNEHSIANLENNDIMEGQAAVVGADQLHYIHVMMHVQQPLAQLMQAVQQQQYQDPMDMARKLSAAIQHVSGHLQYLAQDPARKDIVDQVGGLLKQASSFIPQLQKQAEQMQQQAQQQQAQQQQIVGQAQQVLQDRELEAKIYEINRKYQVESMKQESLNAARQTKTEEQMAIRRRSAESDIQLKAEKQAAELQLARERAAQ